MNGGSGWIPLFSRGTTGPALVACALWLASGAATAAGDAAAGKTSFAANCASCHGPAGKGDGPVASALNPKPRDFASSDFQYDANGDGKPGGDADLHLVIKNGAEPYGGSAAMAAWGSVLSDKEIDDVIAFVRTLHE